MDAFLEHSLQSLPACDLKQRARTNEVLLIYQHRIAPHLFPGVPKRLGVGLLRRRHLGRRRIHGRGAGPAIKGVR